MQLKKYFTIGNLLNCLFFAVIIVLLVNPSAKAILLRGVMTTGLFQPDVRSMEGKPIQVHDITFKNENGEAISLLSLKGKVIFINFWATWCPPCLAEMPSINTLHQKLSTANNIVFIITDVDGEPARSSLFLQNKGYHLPVYAATTTIPKDILTGTIPTTIVINKNGEMVYHHEGVADYTNDKFAEYLQQLLADNNN